MAQKLPIIATLVSLLFAFAALPLWVRSLHHVSRRGWVFNGDRYTLKSERGCLRLSKPPTTPRHQTPVSEFRDDSALAAQITSQRIDWYFMRQFHSLLDTRAGSVAFAGYQMVGGPIPWARGTASLFPVARVAAPLLRELENPDTFVAAHLALAIRFGTEDRTTLSDRPDASCDFLVDGLCVSLRSIDKGHYESIGIIYSAWAHIDTAQLSAIRDQWHDRLDVPIGAVRYRTIVIGAFAWPVLDALNRLRRRHRIARRRSKSRCVNCNYDLRASVHVCPECGTVNRNEELLDNRVYTASGTMNAIGVGESA